MPADGDATASRPTLLQALLHGAGTKCPRCGRGRMFVRWSKLHATCEVCDLRYLRNQGDPWAFLVFIDRAVFILPPIAILYFGWVPGRLWLMVLAFILLIGFIVWTTPNRYGLCVALDYLTRRGPDGWSPADPPAEGPGPG